MSVLVHGYYQVLVDVSVQARKHVRDDVRLSLVGWNLPVPPALNFCLRFLV